MNIPRRTFLQVAACFARVPGALRP